MGPKRRKRAMMHFISNQPNRDEKDPIYTFRFEPKHQSVETTVLRVEFMGGKPYVNLETIPTKKLEMRKVGVKYIPIAHIPPRPFEPSEPEDPSPKDIPPEEMQKFLGSISNRKPGEWVFFNSKWLRIKKIIEK